MTAGLAPFPIFRVFKADGTPLAFGWVHTYAAGTSIPLATYTDSTGNTENPNPIKLDANGQCVLRYGAAAYKIEVRDTDDVTVMPGWPQDYIYPSDKSIADLQATLATTAGAGMIGYSPVATYNRGTVGDMLNRVISVESVIPAGFNTAINDCSSYILTAIGEGNTIELKHDTDYFVGSLSASHIVFDLAVSRFKIIGNNARFVFNTTDGTKPSIFRFKNPNNISIQDVRFLDQASGALTTSPTHAVCIDLADNGPSADNIGVKISNCEASNCAGLVDIRSISGSTYHTREVYLDACRAINCWFGLRATNTGDYVEGSLYCENCVHDVMSENTVGMSLNLVSFHNATLAGSDNPSGAVILKRSGASGTLCGGHKIRLEMVGSTGIVDPIVLLSEDSTAAGKFADLDLEVNLRAAAAAAPVNGLVVVRAFIGTTEQTSTTSSFHGIKISGDALQGGSVGIPPLWRRALATTSSVQGDFTMLCSANGNFGYTGANGYFAFNLDPFHEEYFVIGDATTNFILVPMPGNGVLQIPFFIKIQAFVADVSAGTNSSYREFNLIGNNNGGTITLLSSAAAVYTLDQGVGPTTFPVAVSGSNIKIGPVTGATYAVSTARLAAKVTRIATVN